jgi:sugar O-acyltransferase (sialic acid O-acetyltransferase NeuD family)
MPEQLVILGGAGSGLIVAEAAKAAANSGGSFEVLGFLNDVAAPGTTFANKPILGPFEGWRDCPLNVKFISAFPRAKESVQRYGRLIALRIPDERWATIIHPAAFVSESVELGPGSFVGAGAVIEPGVVGSRHVCIRGGSYVSHDVRLSDFVYIGPNATILGRCSLGIGSHIGANAVCREEISIGCHTTVGIGAVVVANAPDFSVLAGNPAKIISRLEVK